MARVMPDGSIMTKGGRTVFADDSVLAGELCELVALLCPTVGGAGGGGGGFPSGGGKGKTGPQGTAGAAGTSGTDGAQGIQGPQGSSVGAGGWTDDGVVVRLTTPTDQVVIGALVPFATEALRVVGDTRIEGKLTVTGAIDPTSLTLSGGGTAHFIQWGPGSTAPVSAVGTGRIRYNEVSNQFEQSLSGAAYVPFGGGVTFPLLAPDGSAAAPSYSFTNDSDMGMFRQALDVLGFSAGGIDIMRLDGTGGGVILATQNGAFNAPAYSFVGAPTSGLSISLGGLTYSDVGIPLITGDGANGSIIIQQNGAFPIPAISFAAATNTGLSALFGGLAFIEGGQLIATADSGNGNAQILSNSASSVAAPGFSFLGLPDTGLDFLGTDLSFIVGANLVALLSTTQLKSNIVDSAAVPFYTWGTDSDTGMFNSAPDAIGFSAGGVETFTVDATGATVTGKLTVTGAIDPTSLTLSGGGTAHFIQWGGGSTAPVSAAGTGRLIYNEVTNQFQQSLNGAAYVALGGGASFPLLAPDGSAAAPSYSFTNDSDMGMFRQALDVLGFSAGGIDIMRLNGTGGGVILATQNGAFNAPAYSFVGAPTSGLSISLGGLTYSDVGIPLITGDGANSSVVIQQNGAFPVPALRFASGTNTGFSALFGGLAFIEGGQLIAIADSGNGNAQFLSNSAGSVAAPGYSFFALPDTGMDFLGTDLSFIVGANLVYRVSTTQLKSNIVDTAGAPFYTWDADSDTGMFNSAPDTIGFTAGGTETFQVGTTGPVVTLDRGLRLTNQVNVAGVDTGTLLNAPTIGDPAFWLPITINGVNHAIPCWLG